MSMQLVSANALLAMARAGQSEPRVNSALIRPGDTFAALPPAAPGGKGGADFLEDALRNGAAMIACDAYALEKARALLEGLGSEAGLCPGLCVVENIRAFLGELAAAWYGTEDYRPTLLGLTGTNGKTTSAYLLEALLRRAGRKTGVLGTISYRWPGHSEAAPLTTPGCLELHALFAQMRGAGVDTVVMEVSSHALDQDRVAGLAFDAALLTNVTQDHLDYHPDMEAYFQAKARLFRGPDAGGAPRAGKLRAMNLNDKYGLRLFDEERGAGPLIGFGLLDAGCPPDSSRPQSGAERAILRGKILEISPAGLLLEQSWAGQSWTLRSPLVGAFNAMNLLGVQALGLGLGLTPADLRALEDFHGVPGRLERIPNARGLNVFVDYAHTPDALKGAITALRDAGFERIITLFGCGGNRDRKKRPLMGQAVCAYADVAFLTSDNPRKEDPEAIMDDVMPGLEACGEFYREADRRAATARALELLAASPAGKSALLVAGKGHEDYQIIGESKIHYSDQEVIVEILGLPAEPANELGNNAGRAEKTGGAS